MWIKCGGGGDIIAADSSLHHMKDWENGGQPDPVWPFDTDQLGRDAGYDQSSSPPGEMEVEVEVEVEMEEK